MSDSRIVIFLRFFLCVQDTHDGRSCKALIKTFESMRKECCEGTAINYREARRREMPGSLARESSPLDFKVYYTLRGGRMRRQYARRTKNHPRARPFKWQCDILLLNSSTSFANQVPSQCIALFFKYFQPRRYTIQNKYVRKKILKLSVAQQNTKMRKALNAIIF